VEGRLEGIRPRGNNLSQIFGTLGVDGGANLWLLNPNGIVFGENSALDLNGSFFATTADSYVFENEFAYSASNPQVPPILTIDIPTGIQFGSKAESIVNRSRTIKQLVDIRLCRCSRLAKHSANPAKHY